jgi:hypothetical protein
VTFCGIEVDGVYLCITRLNNKYLITVHEKDVLTGRVRATRSTLDGKEQRTMWYSEGTITNWRKDNAAIHRHLADTGHSPSVLFPQLKARGPTGLFVRDTSSTGVEAME